MTLLEEVKDLREKLTLYQDTYYKEGRSIVSDAEYDRLFDTLVRLENEHPELKTSDSPSVRVGSDLSADFAEVEHTIPVLSLDKAYSVGEVLKFVNKVKADLGGMGSRGGVAGTEGAGNLGFVLEEKMDGFSLVLYYKDGYLERAVTRGNGHIGNDVTANVKTIKSVPLRLKKNATLAVRGEVFLYKSDFERINKTLAEPFANARNLAAGTIRRIKSSDAAKVPLSMFCYEGFWEDGTGFASHLDVLKELSALGLPVNQSYSFYSKNIEEIEKDIKERTLKRKDLPYEIDGLVLKLDNLAEREALGYTQHHPRWAIAYKFDSPEATSIVTAIDVQVGRTGRITPMARIKPTKLAGSVIRNITLHNQEYVDELEIALGDTVSISKRGDVIPAVENVIEKNNSDNKTYKIPENCPICGAKIEKRGSHHFCTNYNCPAQEKGRIEFFCAKSQMDLPLLGPSTIELLYNLNYVKSIEDIFTFSFEKLLIDGVEGFGRKKVDSIEEGITNSRNRSFSRILISLGIPEFGPVAVDLVIKAGFDSLDKILSADEEELSEIKGLGSVTAHNITEAFKDERTLSLVNFLKNAGFKMKEDTSENNSASNAEDAIFAGQSWCVTGTLAHFKPRELAIEEIKKRGGKNVSAVSSKTDYLLAGESAGGKLEKARALGVKVVTEDEFLKMIGTVKGEDKDNDRDKDAGLDKDAGADKIRGEEAFPYVGKTVIQGELF